MLSAWSMILIGKLLEFGFQCLAIEKLIDVKKYIAVLNIHEHCTLDQVP